MDLTQLINHPELMDKETLYDLRNTVALYPYYQTARLLMLKNLYLLHEPSFDEELRRAAVYITDRTQLFNLVEAAHYAIRPQGETQSKATATDGDSNEGEGSEGRTISLIDNFLDSIPADTTERRTDSNKRKPTPADAAIDYVAYLIDSETEQTDSTADGESTQQQTPQLKGQALIDDFINNEGGKIQLKDKPEYLPELNDSKQNSESGTDDGFFTETLAKIYIKQGRYSKALEIIRRLNLNYPKKNAYFADQIRFLEKLILNDNTKNGRNKAAKQQ